MVCPTISASSRFIASELELNVYKFRIEPHIDTEIPIGNRYVATSYLKWKSKPKQQSDSIIETFANPKALNLRFSGFNYKFDECDELQE
jgi:hypothetical protein